MPNDRGVTRVRRQLCPYCAYTFDALGTADGSDGAPADGDVTVCMNCTKPMIFDGGHVRKAKYAEELEMESSPDYAEMRAVRAKMRYAQSHGFRTNEQEGGAAVPE
jgi:hypothetical protein